MSLVFALLREDHIIFCADSRQVQGTNDASYLNDKACKIEPVRDNRGLLGFAGHDICEAIVAGLKRKGALDRKRLDDVADEVNKVASEIYTKRFPRREVSPTVEFLLAGFEKDEKGESAMCYRMNSPHFGPHPHWYCTGTGYDNSEVIGKRLHGALYALRKCATSATSVEAGLGLAYFTLMEISQYEISVGGEAQVYVIRPDRPNENCGEKMKNHERWAADVSEGIRRMLVTPPSI